MSTEIGTDEIAATLVTIASRNEINCTGLGEVGCNGRTGWHSWSEHRQHVAREQAAAILHLLANAPAEDNHPTTDTQQGERA